MNPEEILQALRHDLKYAGFTLQNIDREQPLEAWAAKAITKDLFATRRGKSCEELVQEAQEKLGGVFAAEMAELTRTARALAPWRDKLQAGMRSQELYELIKKMFVSVDLVLKTARGAP